MASEKIQAVLYDREQGWLVPLKTGMFPGPFSNGFILEHSPLEKIAKLLDGCCHGFMATVLDILENKKLQQRCDLSLPEDLTHQQLIEYIDEFADKVGLISDQLLIDYRLYFYFFLQYPLVTGKNLERNLTFAKILEEYRQMELPGEVAQIASGEDYRFVWSGDLPFELKDIDEMFIESEAAMSKGMDYDFLLEANQPLPFEDLKTGMTRGPIYNSFLLKYSPLEQIAKLLDFEFPEFMANLFDVIEKKDLKEKCDFTFPDESKQKHLIVCFWSIVRKENIDTRLFLEDYRLYINFFLQYPLVTGKELDRNMTFTKILEEYRQMELPGNVAQVTLAREYLFIWSGALLEELENLDETIASYMEED